MSEFVERLPELAPIIQKAIQYQVVFTAALDTNTRTRQRIEGALAKALKASPIPCGALLRQTSNIVTAESLKNQFASLSIARFQFMDTTGS